MAKPHFSRPASRLSTNCSWWLAKLAVWGSSAPQLLFLVHSMLPLTINKEKLTIWKIRETIFWPANCNHFQSHWSPWIHPSLAATRFGGGGSHPVSLRLNRHWSLHKEAPYKHIHKHTISVKVWWHAFTVTIMYYQVNGMYSFYAYECEFLCAIMHASLYISI